MTAFAVRAPAADRRVRVIIERIDNDGWQVLLPDGKSLACDSHTEAQRAARNYLRRSLGPHELSVLECRF